MTEKRLNVLDGWRGISISLVLAGHLLPLGPKNWEMNAAVAANGMVVFFVLSGFLITNLLLRDSHIGHFLVRRILRIVPLAWLVLTITLIFTGDNFTVWVRNLSFIANWFSQDSLIPAVGHFWSLSLEMQFYVGIALLVWLLGKRGLWFLPVLAAAVTLNRIHEGA